MLSSMRSLGMSIRLAEELFRLRGQLVTAHWQPLRPPPPPSLHAATRPSTRAAPRDRAPAAERPVESPFPIRRDEVPSMAGAESTLPQQPLREEPLAEQPLPEQPLKLDEVDTDPSGGTSRPHAAMSSERGVPSHPVTRAMHFGGLGIGLATGAAAAAVRRALTGESDTPLVMSEANVERLAGTLCRLRGAALKVGQMLSFNDAAVLPPAMRAIMDRVRDGADWMPSWQLKKTMEQELGEDWRQHVVSFEETPIAAASIGQVHRAVLTDGRTVAIKVQYPGVADSLQSDLWSMKQLINYTGVVPPGLYLDKARAPDPILPSPFPP